MILNLKNGESNMASNYFYLDINHPGLNKYRRIKAGTKYELQLKAQAQLAQWENQWQAQCERNNRKASRNIVIQENEENAMSASIQTEEAEELHHNLMELLNNSISEFIIKTITDFKDNSKFCEVIPTKPVMEYTPSAPSRDHATYNPKIGFFTKLSRKKVDEITKIYDQRFEDDMKKWAVRSEEIKKSNEIKISEYDKKVQDRENRLNDFVEKQNSYNQDVDMFWENLKTCQQDAVERYYTATLESIKIPIDYDNSVTVEYSPENKMLIIDYFLPNIEDIPNLKKVTYVKTRQEFKEMFHTEAYMKKLYDNVVYQVVLLVVHCVFSADKKWNSIQSIVFNGQLDTINKATGRRITPYILSVSVQQEAFKKLNIFGVDARAWFKSSKGVSASTFSQVTPIAPILNLNKEDKRFVQGYDVVQGIDASTNLAAMDWKDFENLIREVFEQEFSTTNGEVKVTQASKDGGVDAIAFDPDPIRGGKIVIQAKRYTNVVGVSAVRDLYGTTMNEGASKGILVTTSHFGTDAYDFAKGKPITLLDGSNLLALLEKHGHRAKIDINEAKKMMK